MKNKQTDLVNGNIFKGVFLLGVPLMLSNILQVLFNMSDIAVVGRFAGSNALGSVGSTSIHVMLFTGLVIGVGGGINVAAAQAMGTSDCETVKARIQNCAAVALFAGVFICLLSLFASPPLLRLLDTKPELLSGAETYMRIYSFGFPALMIYNFGNAVLSAAGNTKKPLIILLASGIINVALNVFFVTVIGMDVDGVAYASIISQYLSAAAVTAVLLKTDKNYRLSLKNFKLQKTQVFSVLSLGVPAALQNAIFACANFFILAGVNRLDTLMVKGNSAAANADNLIYDIMAAFYTAGTSFIGQNFGARKRERIKKSYFAALFYSFTAAVIGGVLLLVFGRQFLSLFTSEADVITAGMQRLKIMAFSYAVSAFMDCTIAASRGIGKTLVPTAIVIAGSCVFRIIWVYTIFDYFKTVPSLYLLYVFSWAITAIAEIIYFKHAFKKQTAGFEE